MDGISLKDIAKALEVSKATVSYVLNDRGDEKRVSKETQKKIFDFANKHNYKVNLLARSLSIGKSNMIGIVVPNISDTFFARIARRIEIKAAESGYDVIFSSTGEDIEREQKIIQLMLDRKVDGLVIASCQKNERDILRLAENHFPFVLIDRNYKDIETNFVGIDNKGGISEAVGLLINSGRKRIGFVTLDMHLQTLDERLESYNETMQKRGLDIVDSYIQKIGYNHSSIDVKRAISKMIEPTVRVDSIVFATHFLAAEGIRELKTMDINVPKDIAIVSYGEKSDFDIVGPPVTAIKFPIGEIGDKAVDILLENIMNRKMAYKSLCLKTQLVIRDSCGTI